MDIVYVPCTSAPGLTKFIILYFGTDFIGPAFFPFYPNRAGWVLIHPITYNWYTKPTKVCGNFEEYKQTMLPLRLCCAWKIWKDHGQKI